ncbi:L-2-hydroxyglutarate oxidase [Virgibacillus sp. NKC19-16]|uniref:L-2-hydroxyglutarate oxidase n=1 Tax=Virgibacillus salidurans TaxID=2831673 RepID=UPI001F1B0A8E|nr:L-2-hydroxyglutarate oxidase [Virgibacillus sp. NKC19-16]UJL45553.1 L-2-hydroxyglutarate oxidase [Virgibacillus sp. NKC19-16]
MYDFTIIGGGIVGLSVGKALTEQYPDKKVLVLEKEKELATHQTGNNSGVIHSGIYYKPGSFKARFAKQGSQSMVDFCRKHEIDRDICGKVIVATNEKEQLPLENLYQRGLQNGLSINKLNKEELLEVEPHVNGIEGIHVPAAGIVDYKMVSNKFAEIIQRHDGEIKRGEKVLTINELSDEVSIETEKNSYKTKFLINCAGLQSDRIAKLAGYHIDMKIIPFRGEYFKLKEEKRNLVRNLIYPVPNPDFPFLGVHFTRMIDGEVEAGPNAVLGFKREGYKKTDINVRDLTEVLGYKGFWHLASKYMKEGVNEMVRSVSKNRFVESLQQLIPEIKAEDLEPGPAGVRAQALNSDGSLVDDFHIIQGKNSLHVCNAPSPAATASLEIGKEVVRQITQRSVSVVI